MSGHTKGIMIAEPKLSDLEKEHPRYSVGVQNKPPFFTVAAENGLANTHRLLTCWNSHDALTKQRDDLRAACELVYRWETSEEPVMPWSDIVEILKALIDKHQKAKQSVQPKVSESSI